MLDSLQNKNKEILNKDYRLFMKQHNKGESVFWCEVHLIFVFDRNCAINFKKASNNRKQEFNIEQTIEYLCDFKLYKC